MIDGLTVSDLQVASGDGPIVSGVSLAVAPGQPLTLLGETGSGKSLVAQAVTGTLPAGLKASGSIRFLGMELLSASPAARRSLWGRDISLLPQEPWLALDPTMRIGAQVAEVHRFVHRRTASEATARTGSDLEAVGLGSAAALHPFQMSGGMCQRAAIAVAHAADSRLLLADEPTKGLDAGLRDSVVARLRQEVEAGRLVFTITHDVAVARALGGTVGVMLEGSLIDLGPAEQVLTAPSHPYTRALLDADPAAWEHRVPAGAGTNVVAGRSLAMSRGGRQLFEGIDVEVGSGEIVSVVGPSGCGKTTLGNVLLGLVRADAGAVERRDGVSRLRFQKLYQDPPAAFGPTQTIRRALADLARLHGIPWTTAEAMLARLRLAPRLLDRLPGQISGGELQRFALARALLLDPVFLFADEPTSRLDPVSQQEVTELLLEVVRDTGLGVLLVTHDLTLAERISNRVVRLRPGRDAA